MTNQIPMTNDRMTETTGRFPMGVCAASIVVTGSGLGFAAMGVRWGAVGGETLGLAWAYVSCALVIMWTLIWPMMRGRELGWDFVAILVGAIPAMGVGSFLGRAAGQEMAAMIVLQVAIGILSMGLMRWGKMAAGILGTMAVVMPIFVYVCEEFFGVHDAGCFWGIPVIAVTRVARGETSAGLWWTVGIFLTTGVGLMAATRRKATVD